MIVVLYIRNILYAVIRCADIICNAILLGDPRETISSRMGKYVAKKRGFIPCKICALLNKIDPNHCISSIDDDVGDLAINFQIKNKENL